MLTKLYHSTNLAGFAPTQHADTSGFIEIHDSDRYASAPLWQLREWQTSRLRVVRAAADTELANRALDRSNGITRDGEYYCAHCNRDITSSNAQGRPAPDSGGSCPTCRGHLCAHCAGGWCSIPIR